MICKLCATGADVITQLHQIDKEEVTGENDFQGRDMIHVARFLHSLCKGCDCQHHVRIDGFYSVPSPHAPFSQIPAGTGGG